MHAHFLASKCFATSGLRCLLAAGALLLGADHGFGVTSDNIVEHYVLVGTIADQSAKGTSRNVAVLQEKGGSRRLTLGKGDMLPDGVTRVTAITRSGVALSDGKESFLITYGGHGGSPAGDDEEAASDYFAALQEATANFDPGVSAPARPGEYHYEMKDGIYVLVKDASPVDAPIPDQTYKDNSAATEQRQAAREESKPVWFPPLLGPMPLDRLKGQASTPEGATPFRRSMIVHPTDAAILDGGNSAKDCTASGSCPVTEPLGIEEIPE